MDEITAKKSQAPLVLSSELEMAFNNPTPDPVYFVNVITQESIKLRASDILLEPGKKDLRVRMRIDGVLYEVGSISLGTFDHVSSRIKILSKLDPTEKRRVQEGQYTLEVDQQLVNFRVEIAQTIHGELIVIRLHERRTIVMELAQLGFSDKAFKMYTDMLRQKSGLIIVCGPTGSGKTTTIYSTITKLNEKQDFNVMTIEDPVEYQLEGINQMQTQTDINFTFAKGLKTILRLSPDIVFVGEIRDQETAKIAIESGLTGQLVLTTVHAEDAIGALFRLLDLGVETYLLNSALMGIMAQRLVRKICDQCKVDYKPSQKELDLFTAILNRLPKKLAKGKGCTACNNLGFKGRVGIYEVLPIDVNIRNHLRKKTAEKNFRESIQSMGFTTLLQDGLLKTEQGITTAEEVLRNSLRIA